MSIKTVSRVVNEEAHVTPETSERVRRAIEALAYVPNLAGRRLVHGRAFIIAIIYQNRSWNWLSELQQGVIERALASGYEVLMRPCAWDDRRSHDALARLVDQGTVDGFVLTPPCGDHGHLRMRLAGMPYVAISPEPGADIATVGVDDERGARAMTEHLLDLGHRRIAFVQGDPAQVCTSRRQQGYEKALRERGIEVDPEMILGGDFSFAAGVAAGDRLLSHPSRPTAIFASNDDMAAGVLVSAQRHGLRVPHDLSVTGFDDVDLARMLAPALTTVRQPTAEMGRRAVDRLLTQLDGPAEVGHELMETQLVIRASTAAPSGR